VARYLGVMTVCGTLPGMNSVLLPLPLFMRKPDPPPPGSVVVSIDPTWPVTNAGPLDVMTELPSDEVGEPKSATCVAAEENGSAPRAHAWTADPAINAIARTATGRRARQSIARDLIMSVSLPAFEFGSPDDERCICLGTGSDEDLAG
jgi:hypothetical protein